MNYKPDEAILISYLYGELDAKETEKVRQYLLLHPEELSQLQKLSDTLNIMRTVEDKEVIAPPIMTDQYFVGTSYWKSPYFKTVISVAASFLLIIIAGRLTGLEMNYSDGELRLGFGGRRHRQEQLVQPVSTLTENQVQEMINSSLIRNNEVIAASWNETQEKLNQSIKNSLALNSQKIDGLMKDASQASQDQVRGFVASLQEDNLRLMKDYLQMSSKEQKQYVENLLVDFSGYLKEQRSQDLQLFQTRMSSIEKNTVQFKQETEQILASIISNGSNQKSSY